MNHGVIMGGAPIRKFVSGWAISNRSDGVAHYYRRGQASLALSECRVSVEAAGVLYEPGTRPLCKRCERLLRVGLGA